MNVTRNPAIVVGVSGSPASQAALRWAAAEADRVHGQLRIVMAVERPARGRLLRRFLIFSIFLNEMVQNKMHSAL